MSSLLKKLEDNRTAILLAEIGAYLHVLGKLSEEFIQAQSQAGGNFGYRRVCDNNPLSLNSNFYNFLTDNWVKSIFDSINNVINNIPQSNVSPENLCEFAKYHLKRDLNKFKNKALLKMLTAAHDVSGAEEKDLPWQQGDPKQKKKQADKNNTFSASAFGLEETSIVSKNDLTNIRNSLVAGITPILEHIKQNYSSIDENWWFENYPKIISYFNKAYKCTVGDTQRPVNDVTLWDAASLVAAFLKSAFSKMILEGWCEPIDYNDPNKATVIKWKILRINVDYYALLAKGIKIGDVIGYMNAITDSFNELKKIIEVKYPLGNEIFRDGTGIYFSFPDVDISTLDFWNDLMTKLTQTMQNFEPEISPCIEVSGSIQDFKDLTSQRVSALKNITFPYRNNLDPKKFFSLWSNASLNFEVCPICRLRHMKENSDGCEHCLERRKSRAENWIKDPQQTIWLDEVADHNDRVALLICSFELTDWLNGNLISTLSKKTSSSGRIRRCWETTQDFIQTTIFESILDEYPFGANTPFKELRRKRIKFTIEPKPGISVGATLDIDIEGVRLSPVCVDENKGIFITETNLQILSNKGKTLNEIALWMQGKNIKIKRENDNKWQEGYKISMAKSADDRFQDYIPYIKIYDYPDQFMVLVPAYDAFDIAKKILEEYEIQFSKVRDRLPFHIGIIGFHRRTPLYVAMDAGKRLIETFKNKTKTINAKIDSIDDVSNNKLGKYVRRLKLNPDPCYSSVPIIWHISYSTGDPNQQDEWHSYIRFNGDNPNRGNYSFDYTGNGDYVVHVKELKEDDCITIETSYFNLSFLEDASDRFRIGDDLRPLDEIKRLDDIWNEIQNIVKSKKLGISQLYAYWEEVKKRYEDSGGDSVWENFVKSSLINILKLSPKEDKEVFNKLFQATKDGLLDICLQWNLQVRKIKPAKTQEVKNE